MTFNIYFLWKAEWQIYIKRKTYLSSCLLSKCLQWTKLDQAEARIQEPGNPHGIFHEVKGPRQSDHFLLFFAGTLAGSLLGSKVEWLLLTLWYGKASIIISLTCCTTMPLQVNFLRHRKNDLIWKYREKVKNIYNNTRTKLLLQNLH